VAERQVVIPEPEEVVQVAIQEQVAEEAYSLQKAEEARNVLAVEEVEEPCLSTCVVRDYVLLRHPQHPVALLRNEAG
jgi:hypothetical protein